MGNTPQIQAPPGYGDIVQPNTATEVAAESAPNVQPPAGYGDVVTPERPGVVSRFASGVYQEGIEPLVDMAKGVYHAFAEEPKDAKEHIINIVGGPDGLPVYRLAKHVVEAAESTFKAKPEEFRETANSLLAAIHDFHEGKYRDALADTGAAIGHSNELVGVTPPGEGNRIAEFAEGSRKGGDLATPLGKTAADVALARTIEKAPEVPGKLAEIPGDAARLKELVLPSKLTKEAGIVDEIKKALGPKADGDVVGKAMEFFDKKASFSTIENELKLIKPDVEAQLEEWNKGLDEILQKSEGSVVDAKSALTSAFYDITQRIEHGVSGNKQKLVEAIHDVHDRIVEDTGLGDHPTHPAAVNNLIRIIDDEIHNFASPDTLDTVQKVRQEAYLKARSTLRDLVSKAEPMSEILNKEISRAIKLQDILEKKFPHLGNEIQARLSYQAERARNLADVAKKVAKIAVPVAGGVIGGKEILRHILGGE